MLMDFFSSSTVTNPYDLRPLEEQGSLATRKEPSSVRVKANVIWILSNCAWKSKLDRLDRTLNSIVSENVRWIFNFNRDSTADILATITVDNGNNSGYEYFLHPSIVNAVNTGHHVSHLLQRNVEHDILFSCPRGPAAHGQGRSCGTSSSTKQVTCLYNEAIRTVGQGRPRQNDKMTEHNNPFDPRLYYNQAVLPTMALPSLYHIPRPCVDHNIFLTVDNISQVLEHHTLRYRLFLQSLTKAPLTLIPDDVDTSLTQDNNVHAVANQNTTFTQLLSGLMVNEYSFKTLFSEDVKAIWSSERNQALPIKKPVGESIWSDSDACDLLASLSFSNLVGNQQMIVKTSEKTTDNQNANIHDPIESKTPADEESDTLAETDNSLCSLDNISDLNASASTIYSIEGAEDNTGYNVNGPELLTAVDTNTNVCYQEPDRQTASSGACTMPWSTGDCSAKPTHHGDKLQPHATSIPIVINNGKNQVADDIRHWQSPDDDWMYGDVSAIEEPTTSIANQDQYLQNRTLHAFADSNMTSDAVCKQADVKRPSVRSWRAAKRQIDNKSIGAAKGITMCKSEVVTPMSQSTKQQGCQQPSQIQVCQFAKTVACTASGQLPAYQSLPPITNQSEWPRPQSQQKPVYGNFVDGASYYQGTQLNRCGAWEGTSASHRTGQLIAGVSDSVNVMKGDHSVLTYPQLAQRTEVKVAPVHCQRSINHGYDGSRVFPLGIGGHQVISPKTVYGIGQKAYHVPNTSMPPPPLPLLIPRPPQLAQPQHIFSDVLPLIEQHPNVQYTYCGRAQQLPQYWHNLTGVQSYQVTKQPMVPSQPHFSNHVHRNMTQASVVEHQIPQQDTAWQGSIHQNLINVSTVPATIKDEMRCGTRNNVAKVLTEQLETDREAKGNGKPDAKKMFASAVRSLISGEKNKVRQLDVNCPEFIPASNINKTVELSQGQWSEYLKARSEFCAKLSDVVCQPPLPTSSKTVQGLIFDANKLLKECAKLDQNLTDIPAESGGETPYQRLVREVMATGQIASNVAIDGAAIEPFKMAIDPCVIAMKSHGQFAKDGTRDDNITQNGQGNTFQEIKTKRGFVKEILTGSK